MAAKLRYDTKSCSRCGGSGSYSYCSMYGTTCFKCRGRKKTLSAKGAKASVAVKAFITDNFSVAVEDLTVGDRISVDGKVGVIGSVERRSNSYGSRDLETGEMVWRDGITVTFSNTVKDSFFGVKLGGYGWVVGSKVTKAVAGADWERVVAFARTLKGVTVVDAGERLLDATRTSE